MTQKDSFLAALFPIAIILAAFFFMEQYDRKAKDLKANKQDIIQEEEAIRHHIVQATQQQIATEEKTLPEETTGEESSPPPLHPSNRNSGHFLITDDASPNNTPPPDVSSKHSQVKANDVMDLGHYSKFISSQTTSNDIYHRGNKVFHISDTTDNVVEES
jgi:hypothetical protein